MILFNIKLEQLENGNVYTKVTTPDSVATPSEVEAGLRFKQVISEWMEKEGFTVSNKWKSPNNEIREDS